MFKQGRTKLPLDSAGRLAQALGTDPAHLLRLALSEYEPSLLEAIEGLLAREILLTGDERIVIETVRTAAANRPLSLGEPWAVKILAGAIALIAETGQKRGQAAVEANDRLPPNMRNR